MHTLFILEFFLWIGKKSEFPISQVCKKSESRLSAKLYSRKIINFRGCGNPPKFNHIKVSKNCCVEGVHSRFPLPE